MTKLEHAALKYLEAIEGDEGQPLRVVEKAESELKEQAVLWAQAYWIALVEKK